MRVILLSLGLLLVCSGCLSTKGPQFAMPAQTFRPEAPPDSSRVVFFNDADDLLYVGTGDIQVQVDGRLLPTLGRNEYAQVFLAPGMYQVVLRHWDLVRFSDTYTLEVVNAETYVRVWTLLPLSNQFETLNLSLDYIGERYAPVRVPNDWGQGE